MVGTKVISDPRISSRVFWSKADAEKIFRDSLVLVLDDVDWHADMQLMRSCLIPRRRKFKESFRTEEPSDTLLVELERMGTQADALVAKLYPSFEFGVRRDSWRPMITGPEPLHFDTYPMDTPMITSFVNVSNVPRVYNLGKNLEELVRDDRALMQEIFSKECKGKIDDLSIRLRARTMQELPPLDSNSPRDRVEFAPGSIWFFGAKTVSHEVVYGEGAMSFSWPVLNSDKPMQREIMERL